MADPVRETDPLALGLERVLLGLIAQHERMRAVAQARRAAIAKADAPGLAMCVRQDNEAVQAVASLDAERARLVEAALARFPAPANAGAGWRPTVSWIAGGFEEPTRGRLLALAARLREVVDEVRRMNDAAARASAELAAHMVGILRSVEGRMSRSGAYTRGGVVAASPALVSAMDVTS